MVYEFASQIDAKLSTVLKGNSWCWPPARSDPMVRIQSQLPLVQIGELDQPVWSIGKKGEYSMTETWENIRLKVPPADWWRFVWFHLAIPKHSFILWFAMRDGLVTGAKMLNWDFDGDVKYVFCRNSIVDRDHLFFLCGFSK